MKMNRKALLSAVLLTFALAVSAQESVGTFSLIPRLGVSLANMSNNDVYYNTTDGTDKKLKSKNKAGFIAGVDVEYQVLQPLSLSIGLQYALLGNRYPDYQTGSDDTKQYTGYANHHTDLHYLNVPFMVNLYVSQGLALKAGVQAGVLLDSKTSWEETGFVVKPDGKKEYGKTKNMESDIETKSLDVSIPLGISYEYMNVVLDARYNLGLTNIYDTDLISSKNRFFTFTVGYRFRL